MINVKLPRTVKGDELVKAVEFAMNELEEFEVSDSGSIEVGRSFNARKKVKWYDPFIAVHELTSIPPFIGGLVYFVPIIGQGLYLGLLLNEDFRRCIIKTKIGPGKEYENLDIAVGREFYTDMSYENPFYEHVKDDVEQFISNLNGKLKN